jgi:hypothetical protein
VLKQLLANTLSESHEQALENHVVHCESCRHRLDQFTQFSLSNANAVPDAVPAGKGNGQRIFGPGILLRLVNSSTLALRLDDLAEPAGISRMEPASRRVGSSSAALATARHLVRQYWIWPLIAAVLFSALGRRVHRSVETAMRQRRISELTTTLDADVAALRGWMDSQRAMAQLVADDEQLQPIVQELLALDEGTSDRRRRLVQARALSEFRARLSERLKVGGFTGFLLVSPPGVVLAADDDAPTGTTLNEHHLAFFDSVNRGPAAVSTPLASPFLLADRDGAMRAGLPSMYAAAAIRGDDNQPIAALGLRLRPDAQFTQILRVARFGTSGATYAFDREGVLLSQSRFDDDLKQVGLLVDRPAGGSILTVQLRDPGVNLMAGERPTKGRADQPLTRMAGSAVKGEDGYDVDGYRDYRGVPVVGAWKWLDEYGFGVTTEVDVTEAFAPVLMLRRAFAVLVGLLVATSAGIVLTMLYIAFQHEKLAAAKLAAQKFGQYTLIEQLGRGGMGTVYKARHALLRRFTAVKLLNPEKVSDAAIARFEREVQLTSGLTHPNTVGIYDYGRTPEGVFYYAMEYLEGVNLSELVARYGPLPDARVVYILRQVCASLAEAHAAGLIHRDVKPENILLAERGGERDFVKVLDFGLAKLASDREINLTQTHTVTGTPLYIAPEAISCPSLVDARADVYAIGAVGYFLLTGRPVFSGSTVEELCLMQIGATPEPPSARIGAPVNPELEALLLRCLAKSRLARPDDAADILRVLDACALSCRWTSADAAQWWAQRDVHHPSTSQALSAVCR